MRKVWAMSFSMKRVRPSQPGFLPWSIRFRVWVSPNFWRTPRGCQLHPPPTERPLPDGRNALGIFANPTLDQGEGRSQFLEQAFGMSSVEGAELVRFPTYPIGVGFNEWDVKWDEWEASRFSNAEIEDREIRGMFFRRLNTDFAHTCLRICWRNAHPSNNPGKRFQFVTSTAATFTIISIDWLNGSDVVWWLAVVKL